MVPGDHRRRVPLHRSRRSRASFDQDVWSHAFGLIWFLPGVAGDIPTPSLATFQWFWGTDQGTKLGRRERAARQPLHRHPVRGPKLTKKATDAAVSACGRRTSGVGGAYSNSAFTFEAPPPAPEGGATIRGTALGWWNADEEGTGNYNLGVNGKGEYRYLDEAKRYVPGGSRRPRRILRHRQLHQCLPRAPGFGTQMAHVPLRELPEHRQQLHHARLIGSTPLWRLSRQSSWTTGIRSEQPSPAIVAERR